MFFHFIRLWEYKVCAMLFEIESSSMSMYWKQIRRAKTIKCTREIFSSASLLVYIKEISLHSGFAVRLKHKIWKLVPRQIPPEEFFKWCSIEIRSFDIAGSDFQFRYADTTKFGVVKSDVETCLSIQFNELCDSFQMILWSVLSTCTTICK